MPESVARDPLGKLGLPCGLLDRFLYERFESFCDHLGRNAVDLEKTHATLGPWLAMDPTTERFIDNPAANALLSRHYRQPFVVPKIE